MTFLFISLFSFLTTPVDTITTRDTMERSIKIVGCVDLPNSQTACILPVMQSAENNWLLYQPEIAFWVQDIQLSADSFLVVDQISRSVVDVVHKDVVRDIEVGGNLKCLGDLYRGICFSEGDTRIKFVRGRRSFFNYSKIGPHIIEGMRIFEVHRVNPIYAQLLLLIESPNNPNAVSSAGARGHFQLMPSVAKKYGLMVNNHADERVNFDKSAMAAAKLFKYYCIPSAKRICKELNLEVVEDALWFQLLALHVYNAGSGNVKKAALLNKHVLDGNSLITALWHTRAGAFGNSSQNYSQLCLASYLAYKQFIQSNSATFVTNPNDSDIQ
jgi:hypothetical protein